MSKKIPERIFIQQFEDPKIEGFQADDGATWWTSKVYEHDIEYLRADHIRDATKKVAALREAIDLAVQDLQLAITEQLPYDEVCNDLHQLFEEILKLSKGGE